MASELFMEKDVKLIEKQIADNYALAAKDTVKAIGLLKGLGITPISAHLKIVSRYAVKVLITVSDSDFLKDSFLGVYEKIHALQEKSKNDLYTISFTFINRSKEFDDELVRLDGFAASFRPLEQKDK